MEKNELPNYKILLFFLFLFLISFILIGWLFMPFLSTIILAFVVTGVFSPIYKFLNKKIRASISSFLICVFIFIVLFIPILVFVGILSKEALELYQMGKTAVISDQFQSLMKENKFLDNLNHYLSNINLEITGEQLNKTLSDIGKFVGLFIYEQASSIATNVLSFFFNFFFMLMIIYFLLIDGNKLISFIIDLSPLPKEQDEKLLKKFKDMAGAILIGNGLGGLTQGFLGGVIFAIFGLKSPFMWGVIMGILAFLPIIGIGVIFIPAAIYLFLKGRVAAGVFFVIFYVGISIIIEYIAKPKLVGKKVQMHTLLVFLSIIGGINLFGLLGIIYGPIIVTAFLTLTDIYISNYQKMIEPK
ncbi:MAG: AI-2E family transporter [Desulfobacterales bacterium]|nr:AI-2E family transporter [Desulfobacterales bacterium]